MRLRSFFCFETEEMRDEFYEACTNLAAGRAWDMSADEAATRAVNTAVEAAGELRRGTSVLLPEKERPKITSDEVAALTSVCASHEMAQAKILLDVASPPFMDFYKQVCHLSSCLAQPTHKF